MLVLVNPNNRILSPYSAVEPPLWAGLLATHYRNQKKEVAIVDAEALDLTPEQTAKAVLDYKPHSAMIVVMGNNPSVASTPKMGVTKQLVNLLKKEISLSVTGLHPSALPRETEKELGIYVIPGKIFDGTPDIAWDLLPMDKYQAHFWHCLSGETRSPYASIATSMGCVFKCEFCNLSALYGKREIIFKSPYEVGQEIDRLVGKYEVYNIKFWDELFTFNRGHVTAVCDELIKRNYGLNIWAYARVDCVTPPILKKMKQSGINWLAYGFEAGDDKVLGNAHKHATKEQAVKAVAMTHEAGINVMGNFIFGLPGSSPELDKATLDFAKELNIEFCNFYDFKSYPGAATYKVVPSNWESFDQYGKTQTFRDEAFTSYFTDITYLNHIKAKFGAQAVINILDMVSRGKPVTRAYAEA